jgi:Flp pilus assembly protein TadG
MRGRSVSISSSRNPAGQTMAEFAMVASVFFLLLFCIIEISYAVYNYNTVCTAAREAVRYAIVHPPLALLQPPPHRFSRSPSIAPSL